MRTQIAIIALLFTPLLCMAQARRIAIYDFESQAVRADTIKIYGDDKKVGGIVASRIMSKLLDANGFEVIDRQQIDRLMKEQNLKFSDRFDPRDAPKLGKLLHVDAIVVGSVDAIAAAVKNNRLGIGKLALGGAGSSAQATVSMRVISTESARVFIAESINAKGAHTLSRGGSIQGKVGSDENTIQEAHPEAAAATAALQKAADELAQKIIAKADSLPTRGGGPAVTSAAVTSSNDVPAEASPAKPVEAGHSSSAAASGGEAKTLKVGRVDGTKIFIIGGENVGLKLNQTLEVRHVTGTMKDDAGAVIETDEKVDTIVITEVQDRFAVAKSTSATPAAKEGDRLKLIKTPVRRTTTSTAAKTAKTTSTSGLPAPVQRHQ